MKSLVAPLSPCARSCALSPDGTLAAAGFDDGSLKVLFCNKYLVGAQYCTRLKNDMSKVTPTSKHFKKLLPKIGRHLPRIGKHLPRSECKVSCKQHWVCIHTYKFPKIGRAVPWLQSLHALSGHAMAVPFKCPHTRVQVLDKVYLEIHHYRVISTILYGFILCVDMEYWSE